MRTWLRALARHLFVAPARPARRPGRKPQLERLEDRTVPSITVPTPGQPGPLTATGTAGPDQFIVRLMASGTSSVEVSDDAGAHFTSAALADVTEIDIIGQAGPDVLTVDNQNGFVAKPDTGLPINYDGGAGRDVVRLTGKPPFTVLAEAYTVGASSHSGLIVTQTSNAQKTQTINFTHVSQVVDTLQVSAFAFNANSNNNVVRVTNGLTVDDLRTMTIGGIDGQGLQDGVDDMLPDDSQMLPSLPPVATFVPITFANKFDVAVNTLAGDDFVVFATPLPPAGMHSVTLDAGDGNDQLVALPSPPGVNVAFSNLEKTTTAADAVYVVNLYLERLKRTPADADFAYWTAVLHQKGNFAVASGIEQSAEARTRLVKSWYQHYLGRAAAGGEEQFWVQAFGAGATEEQVLAGIISSPEFRTAAANQSGGGTATDKFVQALYGAILGRGAAASEVGYWSQVVAVAGPSNVVLGFLQSKEYRTNTLTALYRGLLKRDPDAGGLNTWLNSPLSLITLREVILGSAEYANTGQ